MIQFTTPIIPLIVDADLTDCTVYVTFSQGRVSVTKEAEYTVDGQTTTLNVSLTQEETGLFSATKMVQIQANWLDEFGSRGATEISYDFVFGNLLKRVLPDEPDVPDEVEE